MKRRNRSGKSLLDTIKSVVRGMLSAEKAAGNPESPGGQNKPNQAIPQIAPGGGDEAWTRRVVAQINAKFAPQQTMRDAARLGGPVINYGAKQSAIAKNWAKTILNGGSKTPAALVDHANLVLRGVATPDQERAALEAFRKYERVRKTGNTQLGRTYNTVVRAASTAGRIGTLYATATSSGPGSSMALMGLVNEVSDTVVRNLTSKQAKRVFKDVSKTFFDEAGTGAAAFQVTKNFLQRASIFLGGAMLGARVGLNRFDAEQAALEAQGTAYDIAKRDKKNIGRFGIKAGFIERDVEALMPGSMTYNRWLGSIFGQSEALTNEKDRRKEVRAANERDARAAFFHRPEVQQFLYDFAARRGKLVAELTERERAQALDLALAPQTGARGHEGNERVLSKWAAKMDDAAYMARWWKGDINYRMAERRRIYEEEVVREDINAVGAKIAGKEREAERTRQETIFRTPESTAAFRRETRKARMDHEATMKRRQVVELD